MKRRKKRRKAEDVERESRKRDKVGRKNSRIVEERIVKNKRKSQNKEYI
jgi:hypothetical protein